MHQLDEGLIVSDGSASTQKTPADSSPRSEAQGALVIAVIGLAVAFIPYMWWLGMLAGIAVVAVGVSSFRRRVRLLGATATVAGLVTFFGSIGAIGGTSPESTPVGAGATSTPTTSSPSTPPASASNSPDPSEKAGNDPTKADTDQKKDSRRTGRQTVVVTRVIDGDTFEARGLGDGPVPRREVDVRMLEINTVEEGECGYQAATDKLASLLGEKVTIERDQDLKDQYGRWLLYVWSDGVFVNHEMVKTGYAEAKLYEPNDKYWDKINAADTSDTYTPWAPCHTPEPEQKEQPPPQDEDEGDPDTGNSGGLGAGPGDIDCGDVAAPGPVAPGDPDDLDRDGDGIGCDGS